MNTIDVSWPWSFLRYVTLIAVRFLLTYLFDSKNKERFVEESSYSNVSCSQQEWLSYDSILSLSFHFCEEIVIIIIIVIVNSFIQVECTKAPTSSSYFDMLTFVKHMTTEELATGHENTTDACLEEIAYIYKRASHFVLLNFISQ